MVTINLRVRFPFLAPTLAPLVFSVLAPNHVQTGETPSFRQATAVPTGRVRTVYPGSGKEP
jgi:hypothetical protein